MLFLFIMVAGACRRSSDWDQTRRHRQHRTRCMDRSLVGDNGECEKVRRPVCGCDGNTYPNACYAEKAGVARYGVGTCEEQR